MANIKPFREEEAAAENRGFLFYQERCLAKPFKLKDFIKVGWLPAVTMIIYSCTVLPLLAGMLGCA